MPKPSLLCTLGNSWAVVIEAFLLGNSTSKYEKVVAITTSGHSTRSAIQECISWFEEHAPQVHFRVLPIEGLADLTDANSHKIFEEALYRTYFSLLREKHPVHICLAGGFKTMSAAAQEAAGLLGCEKLFHVLAEFSPRADGSTRPPNTHQEIIDDIKNKKIRLIDLGARSSWPTIIDLAESATPLPTPESPFVIDPETPLIATIHKRLEAANRLAASEADLAQLPFPQLARWSPGERMALEQPLHFTDDEAWLLSLPKVELHCHLGGFATHGELLHEVRSAATTLNESDWQTDHLPPPDWPTPKAPIGLKDYRELGDATGSKLLTDPGCLKKHIELLYQHLHQQNIIYAEIRCSPANYTSPGRSAWDVLTEIRNHFERCQSLANESGAQSSLPPPLINLIIIATRQASGDYRTGIARHLALAATAFEHWTDPSLPRVVGVDLAGFEDPKTRAHYYQDDFMAALRLGMGITIHAGENDDAEGIWSAILDLNARRLGHALHLTTSESLMRTVADRHIGIEMCPYANLQIVGFDLNPGKESPNPYPLLKYLNAGIPVTVNTDNIGISAASLTDNFKLLVKLCPGITRLDILKLIRNSIDQSFLDSSGRQTLLQAVQIPRPT